MISSASNSQQYYQVAGTSSASAAASTPASHSVNSALSTPTGTDQLEEGKNGFQNAWLRQLDQEKRVQGTGAVEEHQRVENTTQAQHTQRVADILAQERQKKV